MEDIYAAIKYARVSKRVKRDLAHYVDNGIISLDGLHWMLNALDPFPDTQRDSHCGFPTMRQGKSFVRRVSRSVSVEKPTNVTSSDKWEAIVWFNPLFQSTLDAGVTTIDGVTLTPTSATLVSTKVPIYSGCNAQSRTTPAGLYSSGVAAGDQATKPGLALDDSYQQGEWRIIACGIEIHNTSAVLTRQGSVTVGRLPVGVTMSQYQRTIGTTPPVSCVDPLMVAGGPPNDLSVLTQYPGARTWAAEKGAYLVCSMNNDQNPPQMQSTSYGWIGLYEPFDHTGTYSREGFGTFHNSLSSSVIVPWDTSIAWFAGLSADTTLRVTVHYYVETFPQPAQIDLIGFSSPTTPYDAMIMEMYARAMREMPPGVPVGMNPLGEWFNKVMSVLANVAPKIGTVIGTATGFPEIGAPAGLLVAEGAKALGRANSNARKRRERRKLRTARQTSKALQRQRRSAT